MYVEGFCGTCTVLLHKIPCVLEICNDINTRLVGMWRVIQNKHMLDQFKLRSEYEISSRELFELYKEPTESELENAFRFFYVNRYSYSSLTKTFAGIHRRRAQKPETYSSAIKRIDVIYNRIKKVTFENQTYEILLKRMIKNFDYEDTLIYLDPPYFVGGEEYNSIMGCNYEWNNDIDHAKLIDLVNQFKHAKIVISIDKPDYVDVNNGWYRQIVESRNTTSQKYRNMKEEYIFRNFDNEKEQKMSKLNIKQKGLI